MDEVSRSPDGHMVLRTRALAHLPELRIAPNVFESRFAEGCATTNCDATCCRAGVDVDIREHDQIVAHAALVQQWMDPQQERNPARWFDGDEVVDGDMPSGRALSTAVRNGACVFLNSAARCVLQVASTAAPEGIDLKPFFCSAFPLTIDGATLTLDPHLPTREACCRRVVDGPLTVFDVAATELRYVLGDGGVRALREANLPSPRP